MARRGKSNGNGHAAGEPPEASNATGAERLDKLPDIAARIDSAKSKSDEARSDLGHIYHQAEEDGFNRRALKEAVRLRNMEADKRRDYLASLNAYCDKLGIWAQADLFQAEPRPPDPIGAVRDEQPDAYNEAAGHMAERSAEANQDAAGYTHEVGRQAGIAGTSGDDNPWPDGTKAHATWNSGWLAGQEELVASATPRGARKRGRPRRKDSANSGGEAQVH